MNAYFESVELKFWPDEARFQAANRLYQGVPTLAITRGGRFFAGWCSGGNGEPRIENFNVLCYSDDRGKTWGDKPMLAIESDKEKLLHVYDVQLWVDEKNTLHIVWVQEDARLARPDDKVNGTPDNPMPNREGYVFEDHLHSCWEILCEEPDAEKLVFTEPKRKFYGFLRCKPLVTESGKTFCFAYDQLDDRYGFNVSTDGGMTWKRKKGGRKLLSPFDEAMAYQLRDGSIRMLARSLGGYLAESWSYDDGENWTDGVYSDIVSPSSRFYVSRTPSGKMLLAVNDDKNEERCRMSIKLSDDDGKTWPWSVCIDEREDVSYPDIDFYDGKIYMVYDHGRTIDNEILFVVTTEEDIMNGVVPEVQILSKPGVTKV